MLSDPSGASNSFSLAQVATPLPIFKGGQGGTTSKKHPKKSSRFRLMSAVPRQKPAPISPIFIGDSVTLHVSREKDGKLPLVDPGRTTLRSFIRDHLNHRGAALVRADQGDEVRVSSRGMGATIAKPVQDMNAVRHLRSAMRLARH